MGLRNVCMFQNQLGTNFYSVCLFDRFSQRLRAFTAIDQMYKMF